ncbi:kinase-like domain-containing protein [Suillus lakei]|nr:kinase-like domain-containing protein [Suillus lakei]
MKEVDLMKRLSHPSIVKYEGIARDDQYINIVLEYAENSSLGQILKAFGKLNENLVASYIVKILEVVELLTGHPPFGDITNIMTDTVMSRIVEDEMPIPEECSKPLKDFLQQ